MNESTCGVNTNLYEMQTSVEQHLGRCMLRLQKYETVLKKILPYASFSGHRATLPALLAETTNFIGGKTLGAFINVLTETYLGPAVPTIASRTSMSATTTDRLEIERQQVIKVNLEELVILRATLVHEFAKKFDLDCIEGCLAADAFLQSSLKSIDSHLATLRAWAETLVDAHALTASLASSTTFRDFLSDGISPEGTIHWSVSGIVLGLQDAESELSLNGWTSLSSAIAWIHHHAPEQIPKRYGCTTWPQVLQKSQQFDVFKQRSVANKQKQNFFQVKIWYRSRRLPVDD